MEWPDQALAAAVVAETTNCLNSCMAKIKHCLGQLSDQQVWWRPQESMNSIGNLILHLCGNVRQWIVAGISGAPDLRDRPREFSERQMILKDDLLGRLEQVIAAATAALAKLNAEELARVRRIQGFNVTALGAIFDSVPHFKGHTQEIICLTRMQLGEGYKYDWVPKTAEEGGPVRRKEHLMGHPGQSIEYVEGGGELLDLIAPLWAELGGHHQAISEHFSEAIAQRTFASRKAELVEKGRHGHLRVDLVRTGAGECIGYCVSTIDSKQTGEVDSIYVQPPFRNQDIGHALMERAMRWMDGVGTQSRIVEVAWGNEAVWPFYQRYGFLPRSVRFVQKPSNQRADTAALLQLTPWLSIPLSDYEGHMSLPGIGQADMLSSQFAALLAEYSPASVAVIGCAGGNGFDRVSPEVTRRVVGIDINRHYVEELSRRYAGRIPGLELYVGDIQAPAFTIEPVDLLYAALVFEYVEAESSLRSLRSMCRANGVLAVVLQLPSKSLAAISPSPFTSLQALGPAMHLLSPDALCAQAHKAGFVLKASHTLSLPSGKEFVLLVFQVS